MGSDPAGRRDQGAVRLAQAARREAQLHRLVHRQRFVVAAEQVYAAREVVARPAVDDEYLVGHAGDARLVAGRDLLGHRLVRRVLVVEVLVIVVIVVERLEPTRPTIEPAARSPRSAALHGDRRRLLNGDHRALGGLAGLHRAVVADGGYQLGGHRFVAVAVVGGPLRGGGNGFLGPLRRHPRTALAATRPRGLFGGPFAGVTGAPAPHDERYRGQQARHDRHHEI